MGITAFLRIIKDVHGNYYQSIEDSWNAAAGEKNGFMGGRAI